MPRYQFMKGPRIEKTEGNDMQIDRLVGVEEFGCQF
jgi:hypothetical protein